MNQLYILTLLCANVVLAEWLVKIPFFRHWSAALLVIITTAITANLGLIPSSGGHTLVYEGIFAYVAPLAIFFLMLKANLLQLRRAGSVMLILFLLGSVGTMIGVGIAFWAFDAPHSIGALHYAIGGMFTGTYIGGSVNFNAVALHYGVAQNGLLYAASTAADNIITALWMAATLALPKLLGRRFPRQQSFANDTPANDLDAHLHDQDTLDPMDLGILLGLGFLSIYIGQLGATWVKGLHAVLVQTTFALLLAQIPAINRLRGSRLLGMFCVYLFLAVIGAYCDIPALLHDGQLAITLLGIITLLILVHAAWLFGIGAIWKKDWDLVSIASQANIGGASSALALARSLNRPDLQLPAVLIGVLGNAIGTYLGIWIAEWMR